MIYVIVTLESDSILDEVICVKDLVTLKGILYIKYKEQGLAYFEACCNPDILYPIKEKLWEEYCEDYYGSDIEIYVREVEINTIENIFEELL